MILLLNTSEPSCELVLVDEGGRHVKNWQADRQLAKGLLAWLRHSITVHGSEWSDIRGIGVYRGPGSFTGLRIGLTVMNTLAESLDVPIVGVTGSDWRDDAVTRLEQAENDRIIMPFYDRDATVTTQRK